MKKLFNKYFGAFCILGAVLVALSAGFGDIILNKPIWIFWSLFAIGFAVSLYLTNHYYYEVHKEKSFDKIDKFIAYSFSILKTLVLALILTFIIRIPLDYYIISKSKDNISQYESCLITNHTSSKIKQIYFIFNKKTEAIVVDSGAIKKLEQSNADNNYIVIYYKESILSMSVVTDYNF